MKAVRLAVSRPIHSVEASPAFRESAYGFTMLPVVIRQPPWFSKRVKAAPSRVKSRRPAMRSGSPGYHVSTVARLSAMVPLSRKRQLNYGPPGSAIPRCSAKTPATTLPETVRVSPS